MKVHIISWHMEANASPKLLNLSSGEGGAYADEPTENGTLGRSSHDLVNRAELDAWLCDLLVDFALSRLLRHDLKQERNVWIQ